MGLTLYLRQKRISLRVALIFCLVSSAFTGVGVYFYQKALRRSYQGLTYMSQSLLLLKVLRESSPDSGISEENIQVLESMAYSSALFGMLQGEQFRTHPVWLTFIKEMQEYIRTHPREIDSPVMMELKKMLAIVLADTNGF